VTHRVARWAVELIASALTITAAYFYFYVAFGVGDGGRPTPIWFIWFAVACAVGVAVLGFGAGMMSRHFPWLALLASCVGIVAVFSLLGLGAIGGLLVAGCAAVALGCGALPTILWSVRRGSAETEVRQSTREGEH
jgi:hypothetical protein